MSKRGRLPKRWFKVVKDDLSKLPDAIEWYEQILDEAFAEADISGNLQRALQEQPGLIGYYDAMHTDIDLILDLMEKRLKQTKADKLRQWAENPPTNVKMNSTDTRLLIEADPDVVFIDELVMETRYTYKTYSGLLKALDSRGYTLNNITKLRSSGMEEVEV